MNIIKHHNVWLWGESWTLVANGGIGLISISLEEEEATIHSLSIIPEERGKGLGTQLIKEAEKLVEDVIGLEFVSLSVEPGMENLKEWYERLGYVYIGEDEEGYIEMTKWLGETHCEEETS